MRLQHGAALAPAHALLAADRAGESDAAFRHVGEFRKQLGTLS